MTKNLNCKTCGQNVMVSGLKAFRNDWYCRECIEKSGGDITLDGVISRFNNPVTSFRANEKTLGEILSEIKNYK